MPQRDHPLSRGRSAQSWTPVLRDSEEGGRHEGWGTLRRQCKRVTYKSVITLDVEKRGMRKCRILSEIFEGKNKTPKLVEQEEQ